MESKPLVPKLRFPEFMDDQSWESMPLGKLGRFLRGLTYAADDVTHEGLLVLRSGNIQRGRLILDSDLVFVSRFCPDDLRLRNGDVVICMSNGSKALVGKSAEYRGERAGQITVGAFCSIFRPLNSFAKVAFSTPQFDEYVASEIAGGNINNLKNLDLEVFMLATPRDEAEQQKIADCLTSLDELIAAEEKKLEALRAHKKGLLQSLFPREGDTPPLRFPEFQIDGNWVRMRLREVLFETKYRNRGLEYGPSQVLSVSGEFGCVNQIYLLGRSYAGASVSEYKLLRTGDVVYTKSPLKKNPFGIIKVNKRSNGIVSTLYAVYGVVESCHPEFIDCYFDDDARLNSYLEPLVKKGPKNDMKVNNDDVLSGEVSMPFRKEEQRRIADFISSIDELIVGQVEKLTSFKRHKRGLMQGLFPRPETA